MESNGGPRDQGHTARIEKSSASVGFSCCMARAWSAPPSRHRGDRPKRHHRKLDVPAEQLPRFTIGSTIRRNCRGRTCLSSEGRYRARNAIALQPVGRTSHSVTGKGVRSAQAGEHHETRALRRDPGAKVEIEKPASDANERDDGAHARFDSSRLGAIASRFDVHALPRPRHLHDTSGAEVRSQRCRFTMLGREAPLFFFAVPG